MVTIYDPDGFFSGAAVKNQQRLHLGYHYLRSHGTRKQAKSGYAEFLNKYSQLTRSFSSNLYAVPFFDSLLDWDTISQILGAEDLPYRLVDDFDLWSRGLEAVFETDERVIDGGLSRQFFRNLLGDSLVQEHVSYSQFQKLGKEFDFVIDATYSSTFRDEPENIYEATLIAQFNQTWGREFFQALTLVDGNLWSIFPTDNDEYSSLSHVTNSSVFQSTSELEVQEFINEFSADKFESRLESMRDHVIRHVPGLMESLRGLEVRFLTKKIKNRFLDSRRTSNVSIEGKFMFVNAGKIDAIFESEREVERYLESLGAL